MAITIGLHERAQQVRFFGGEAGAQRVVIGSDYKITTAKIALNKKP